MIPYELVLLEEGRPKGLLADWPLEDRERRALKTMLLILFQIDGRQAVGSVIFPTDETDIYYAKATGKVQIRPRLCRGPARPNDEVTFLVRATKKGGTRHGKGGKLTPANADSLAAEWMVRVTNNPALRRRYRPPREVNPS